MVTIWLFVLFDKMWLAAMWQLFSSLQCCCRKSGSFILVIIKWRPTSILPFFPIKITAHISHLVFQKSMIQPPSKQLLPQRWGEPWLAPEPCARMPPQRRAPAPRQPPPPAPKGTPITELPPAGFSDRGPPASAVSLIRRGRGWWGTCFFVVLVLVSFYVWWCPMRLV